MMNYWFCEDIALISLKEIVIVCGITLLEDSAQYVL